MKTIITQANEIINQDKILSFDVDIEIDDYITFLENKARKHLRIVIVFGTNESEWTTLLRVVLPAGIDEDKAIEKVADLTAMELLSSNVVRASLLKMKIEEMLKEM